MRFGIFSGTLCSLLASSLANAQIIDPAFLADYSYADLGTPGGIPGPLGGIAFKPSDPNILLLGGSANNPNGQLYELPVTRNATGHIAGFAGPGVSLLNAPNIDGGVAFSFDGILFITTYNTNRLLQYNPGSTDPDDDQALSTWGVPSSVGTCQFVPLGFPGAGRFKVASFSTGQWFDFDLFPSLSGPYFISNVTPTTNTGGGPEGIVYIHGGNPGFVNESVLISEYSAGAVRAYEIDAEGNPLPATRRDFITGLTGVEGAVIDPLTGDFLFSTYGSGNRVIVVSGFDQPSLYCGGKVASNGCRPTITFTGLPTLTGPDDFTLIGTDVLNNSFGILLWSLTPDTTPFGGGTLCLNSPTYRFPIQFSGGSAGPAALDCSGSYADFLSQAWFAQNGLLTGMSVYAQYLGRDAGNGPGNNYSLSDAIRFTIRN